MSRQKRILLFIVALVMILNPVIPVMAAISQQNELKVGNRGEKVVELQNLLKKTGLFPESQVSTGYFGPITYNSVTQLESKNGLAVDGVVGEAEWNILYERSSTPIVFGYYTTDYPGDKLSYGSLSGDNHNVGQTAFFDFCIDEWGSLNGTVSVEGIKLARQKGSKALMVVHNISGSIDSRAANSIFSNQTYSRNLINNIVYIIEKNGYDGVNIDIEGISANNRSSFNSFLNELNNRLEANGRLLTVAVPAKTSAEGNSWNAAYDYNTIGRLADYVVIMSYDEHWINGKPGPVASVPWVTSVLDYTVGAIPPQKVLMGIAAFGYDWPDGQRGWALRWFDMSGLSQQYGTAK